MSHTYVRPYVEKSNNVVKEPANVNVLVSEARTYLVVSLVVVK